MSTKRFRIPHPSQGQKPEKLHISIEQRMAPNPEALAVKPESSLDYQEWGTEALNEHRKALLAVLEQLKLGDRLYFVDYFALQLLVWKTNQGIQVYTASGENTAIFFSEAKIRGYTALSISD